MQTINCYIPLKLRVRGEPGEDDWAALEERLVVVYTRLLKRSVAELRRLLHTIPTALEVEEPPGQERVGGEGGHHKVPGAASRARRRRRSHHRDILRLPARTPDTSENVMTLEQTRDYYEREADANDSSISTLQPTRGNTYASGVGNAIPVAQPFAASARLNHNTNQVRIQRKKKPPKQKPPEEPSEEEQEEIDDLAATITEIVESGVGDPLHFKENWQIIQRQIEHPTKIASLDKRKEKKFPELYEEELVDRLKALKRSWLVLVSNKVKEQLVEHISAVPHPGTGKGIDYNEEYKALQPIIRAAFPIEQYILVRDALVRRFSPSFDFEEAKKNIGNYYSGLVSANFPTEKSKSSDALVHPNLQQALKKAMNLLWNLGWAPEDIDGIVGGIKTLGGYEVRPNVNKPTAQAEKSGGDTKGEGEQVNLSYHSFGWAIDINPEFNPNVRRSDFPAALVEGFTHEDVYKGKNITTIRPELALPKGKRSRKLARNLPKPTVEETLTAVRGLYEASKKFQAIYENKSSFRQGLIDYMRDYTKDKGKRSLPDAEAEMLFTTLERAYKEREANRREQEQRSKKKDKKQASSTLPVSDQLLSELTHKIGVERADAEEMAKFMLEAYDVFVKSREMKTVLVKDPHSSTEQSTIEPATIPQEVEIEGKKVDPKVQGTKATIAAHGFINLVPELITALVHSDGGGLKWLGTSEGTKDFMHFELEKKDQPKLPGD